jgi:Di-haem oxidoreductase, putative peroxidase
MLRSSGIRKVLRTGGLMAVCALAGGALFNVSAVSSRSRASGSTAERNSAALVTKGRQIFRFDTFGDEAFWSGALQLDKAIAGSKNGGVGPGVSPATALKLGLKVDASALPKSVVSAIKAGKVDLNSPATTLALLKLNAVVGVKGNFTSSGKLSSIGLTCAVCHSTVNDSFAPGIGQRRDGWPNRDLNVGAIVSAAPNLKPVTDVLGVDEATVKKVLASWGPGKFDAELFMDGRAFQPDGRSAATLIPPAYGLAGVNLHTYTGWGSVPYWNAFVAILEMHGQGNFTDERLDNAAKFPIAAKNRFGHVRVKGGQKDLVRAKLPALQAYELSLKAPQPPSKSFDHAAAARGKKLFDGGAGCASCHMPPQYTDPGWNMHQPGEVCEDDFQASRSPDNAYRTTPLGGLGQRNLVKDPRFYHDGRFNSLGAVVDHYNSCNHLNLSASQKSDLVEYLKSL